MPIASFMSNQGLNCMLRGVGISAPASPVNFHAYNGDPRAAGTELASSNGYAPIAIPAYGTASGNTITNSAIGTWPTATGSWTTPWNYTAFIDNSSNLWWAAALLAARTIVNTDIPTEPIGLAGIGFTTNVGTYFGDMLLNCLCNGTAVTAPSNMYLAPFNGDPLAGGTELTTNGATRILIPTFAAASAGSTTNTTSTSWTVSGNWSANFDHVAFIDASSSGNIWFAQPLNITAVVFTPDSVIVPINALVVSIV